MVREIAKKRWEKMSEEEKKSLLNTLLIEWSGREWDMLPDIVKRYLMIYYDFDKEM